MEKAINNSQLACDEALHTLFKVAYFTGKQSLPYYKFLAFYLLLKSMKVPIMTSMYHDEKACANLVYYILVVL